MQTETTNHEESGERGYYDFSQQHQLELLAAVLKNPALAAEVLVNMKAIHFDKDEKMGIFDTIKDFYIKFGVTPRTYEEFEDHIRTLTEIERKRYRLTDSNFRQIKYIAPALFDMDGYELVTIPKATRVIKKMTMRDALKGMITDLIAENYEKMEERFEHAIAVGTGLNGSALSSHLLTKYESESHREAEMLGYRMDKFKTLANHLDGIQKGFYIIGAETSSGKTALATNLFLDVLMTNPETTGLYFSLDDNRNVIINRLLGILSTLNLNQLQRKQPTDIAQQLLKDAYDTLIQLSTGGRLDIRDISEIHNVKTLEALIKKQKNRENLIVVIDGLYNLEVSDKARSIREDNIERANRIKALVDTYQIPIICTGELRKRGKSKSNGDDSPDLADMMETGKFAYNANAVLLLYPENRESYKYDEEPILVVDYGKNKLSSFKGIQQMKFKTAKGIVEEIYNPLSFNRSEAAANSSKAVFDALDDFKQSMRKELQSA